MIKPMHYDFDDIMAMGKFERANFINSLSGHKSANLVGTRSTHGVTNLALISSAFHVGANPPLIGMLMRPHTVTRDTLQNIKECSFYTINHVHSAIVEQSHQCSARYPSEISEFQKTGLSAHYVNGFFAPFVEQSRIKMGVQVKEVQRLDINQTELVIGEIVHVILEQEYMLEDGYIDIEKADSVAVSGLDSYHQTKRIDRYNYAKADADLESIWKK